MPRTAKGSGEPLKLLQLLWSPDTKVGRSGTTVAGVVQAAIELADGDGLDALTMRAVAQRVGVGAMTLYGYVPGKPELIELMLDTVVAETYAGHHLPGDLLDWRSALRHVALRNYDHAMSHPWTAEAPPSRPILGPGHLLKYENELAPLDGIGLQDLEMDQALTHVLALVQYASRWQLSMQRVRTETSLSDEQWWRAVAPNLGALLGDTELRVSSRVGESLANAGDPDGFWRRGLETVIAGIDPRITEAP